MFHPLIGAAVLAAALAALPAGAAPLTLQAALDRAVQRSEATRAARASVLSASEAASAAAPSAHGGLMTRNALRQTSMRLRATLTPMAAMATARTTSRVTTGASSGERRSVIE